MTTVAILGRGASRADAATSGADEFWGVGQAYRDHEFPLQRVYEIHPLDMLAHPNYDREHWEWLRTQPADGPTQIVMLERFPAIPASVPYPLDEALAMCDPVRWGQDRKELFTSSFDYAIAHAILEGVDAIELYGVDMSAQQRQATVEEGGAGITTYLATEYVYQRPGAFGWIMYAAARGIRVTAPKSSPLFEGKRYGIDAWDGAQSVSVAHMRGLQNGLRALRSDLSAQMRDISGKLETIQGDADRLPGLQKIEKLRRLHMIADGAFNALEYAAGELEIQGTVGRMMLEKLKREYTDKKHGKMSAVNRNLGQLDVLRSVGDTENYAKFRDEFKQNKIGLFVAIGAEQAMGWLVDDCDLKPNGYRIIDPVSDFRVE
ncbi:MAG: hypothetical protein ACE5EX_06420, partial [Phycisphaerae bacterium]